MTTGRVSKAVAPADCANSSPLAEAMLNMKSKIASEFAVPACPVTPRRLGG
jgi:hypothetical protein